MEDRNRKVPGDKVPRDLLSVVDAEVLCKWLCCFVQETRKESGERYPPLTLRQLLCAFQRVYAEPDSSTCPVRILDTYLSKLPHNPPAFYLQWMPKTPKDPSRP